MPDDLDPQLLRAFAQADSTLPGEPFVSEVARRMQPAGGLRLGAAGLYSLLGTVLGAVTSGLLLPLRMRQTRLMTIGAAAFTIWAAFL
jgi:hypothetical protein